jgi:hypothetical protein
MINNVSYSEILVMAWQQITKYALSYIQGLATIYVQTEDNGNWEEVIMHPQEAVYVADILRNEKPVFYDPDFKKISTSDEVVGEQEG